jgi:hypothetical protein
MSSLLLTQHTQVRRFDCVNLNTGDWVAPRHCPEDKPNLGDAECPLPPECVQPAEVLETSIAEEGGADNNSTNVVDRESNEALPGSASSEVYTVAPALGSVTGTGGNTASLSQAGKAGMDGSDSSVSKLEPKAEVRESVPFLAAENQGVNSNAVSSNSNGQSGVGLGATSETDSTAAGNATSTSSNSSSNSGDGSVSGAATNAAQAIAGDSVDPANSSEQSVAAAASSAGGVAMNAPSQSASDGGSAVHNIGTALDSSTGLPIWMVETPTASLSAMLNCPKDLALSANGTCCNSE